jgi:hypothetical protein
MKKGRQWNCRPNVVYWGSEKQCNVRLAADGTSARASPQAAVPAAAKRVALRL